MLDRPFSFSCSVSPVSSGADCCCWVVSLVACGSSIEYNPMVDTICWCSRFADRGVITSSPAKFATWKKMTIDRRPRGRCELPSTLLLGIDASGGADAGLIKNV